MSCQGAARVRDRDYAGPSLHVKRLCCRCPIMTQIFRVDDMIKIICRSPSVLAAAGLNIGAPNPAAFGSEPDSLDLR